MERSARIHVAGHRGLVGSAIVRRLRSEGFANLLLATSEELDLRDMSAVQAWYRDVGPEYVFLAAGNVGGIWRNVTHGCELLHDNVLIATAVTHAAYLTDVKKLLYLGSSCIYPRDCPQPMQEELLLSGPLEPTNEGYALAKIVGIKLCELYRRQHGCNFISAMPTNIYGPNDSFDLAGGHVLPALMRKFYEASRDGLGVVPIWGTGTPRREFLHADDLADACLFLMRHYDGESHVNVGTGTDVTIRELSQILRRLVAPNVELVFDASKPDGMPRKLLDVSTITSFGWSAKIELEDGIRSTMNWLAANYNESVGRRTSHGW